MFLQLCGEVWGVFFAKNVVFVMVCFGVVLQFWGLVWLVWGLIFLPKRRT